MAVAIVNGIIQIFDVRNNSTLGRGKNIIQSLYLYSKRNTPFGEVIGNLNVLTAGVSILSDPDVVDTPTPSIFGCIPSAGAIPEVV